ncbi:LLM class flavin-dependent oxidoreductase [Rubrivivax gelatinosus]|uniref:LLM class flavin-dependent oxidoreductase n=1 Tax=Rubrivivax gelatinosus TaxID=28068 RepID=UPI001906B89D|nr:LLM class flavin-dependent oxidoreductase [Rubrivivax gelatinosus]MBK1614179.1 LLM class flavin-dependent oxidoreductase [Rubrivivax gelatinosus]
MRLSVLDQSPAAAGRGEDEAIRASVALAEHCEALGYERFWVSEHHNLAALAGTAPEVLLAAIAARTRRMRLGSAGVMLPHYAPLKVAEQFRVLDALAPGRIDLGVGRAPGGDMRTAAALNPNALQAAEDFPQAVADLQAWVGGTRHGGIVAHPRAPEGAGPARTPEVWILGSSTYGAQLAAHMGLPYAFAYFFADGQGVEAALDLYRGLYRPSARHPRPEATICVWALAADDDASARFHALSRERWWLDRQRGRLGALPRPEDVALTGFEADEEALLAGSRAKTLVGAAADVAARLQALAGRLALDHVVVNTWAHDEAVRQRSYTLLAREFGLAPQTSS